MADQPPLLDSAGVYRDDRPGSEARRDALLDERRRELVMMPLVLSHVFAHRIGRTAAGAAALLAAAAVALMLADPLLGQLAAVVPERNVPICVALVGVAILAVYIAASRLAERVFERRIREAITTRGAVYADLDHLAEGPLEVGHQLVRRSDRWAMMLAIAGATAVFSELAYVAFALGVYPDGVVYRRVDEIGPIGWYVTEVALAMVPALIGAVLVGRACDRELRAGELPRWVRALGHSVVLPAGTVIGLGGLYVAVAWSGRDAVFPALRESGMVEIATLGVIVVFQVVTWIALWWRRREHTLLGSEGCYGRNGCSSLPRIGVASRRATVSCSSLVSRRT